MRVSGREASSRRAPGAKGAERPTPEQQDGPPDEARSDLRNGANRGDGDAGDRWPAAPRGFADDTDIVDDGRIDDDDEDDDGIYDVEAEDDDPDDVEADVEDDADAAHDDVDDDLEDDADAAHDDVDDDLEDDADDDIYDDVEDDADDDVDDDIYDDVEDDADDDVDDDIYDDVEDDADDDVDDDIYDDVEDDVDDADDDLDDDLDDDVDDDLYDDVDEYLYDDEDDTEHDDDEGGDTDHREPRGQAIIEFGRYGTGPEAPAERSSEHAALMRRDDDAVFPGAARGPLRLGTVARYLVYVLLVTLLGAGIGIGSTFAQADVYGAETEIIFELDENLEAGFLREDRRLTTQVVTIQSRAILGPAGELVGLSPDEFAEVLTVSVISGSEIIAIRASGPTEEDAVERAAAVATTYLAWLEEADSTETARAIVEDELAAIEAEQELVREQILELSGTGAAIGEEEEDVSAELAILLGRDAGLTDQRIELEARQRELALDDLVKPRFSLLTEPYPLDGRLEPRPIRSAALGALLGAVVGVAVVFIAENRNPRLR